jgi:uncharacterized protein (DUF305 family)
MKNLRNVFAGAALAFLASLGGLAIAQHAHDGHGSSSSDASPMKMPADAREAFEAANAKMHKDMAIALSGDADVDFVRGMIPHHQGAIDMARILLQHGKDPELRKLAGDIIQTQETEIAWMRSWLTKQGK